MAKRELSSTLRNLKFMQRAALREEQSKKEEEVKPDGNFFSHGTVNRKCVVVMEGDPPPGAVRGRMSFQSFNPSIEKLNEEAANPRPPVSSATSSGNESERMASRENGSSRDEVDCSNTDRENNQVNGDLKRKQSEAASEARYLNKSPKNIQGDQKPSPNDSRGSFKKVKGEKLDWNVLRPSKTPNKRG